MHRKQYLLMLALVACSVMIGAAFAGWEFAEHSAQAQQEGRRGEARKWEYCSINFNGIIGREGGATANVAVIDYHRSSGEHREEVEGASVGDALGRALFKLGENGWELVSASTWASQNGGATTYHFKRLKS
jgi:hypothetical protein